MLGAAEAREAHRGARVAAAAAAVMAAGGPLVAARPGISTDPPVGGVVAAGGAAVVVLATTVPGRQSNQFCSPATESIYSLTGSPVRPAGHEPVGRGEEAAYRIPADRFTSLDTALQLRSRARARRQPLQCGNGHQKGDASRFLKTVGGSFWVEPQESHHELPQSQSSSLHQN